MVLRTAIAAACMAGTATIADATPITYDWMSGEATVSATNSATGAQLLAPGATIALTASSQVTFDSAALTIPSFEFTDQGTASLALQGALSGDTLLVTKLTATPDSVTYSSSASGTNPYNITLGEVDFSGTYEVVNAATDKIIAGPRGFTQTDPTLNGQVTLSGDELNNLSLTGVTFGAVSVAGATVILKGDIEFSGVEPVPVPSSVGLLASGLIGVCGIALVRRRSADKSFGGSDLE